MQSLPTWGAWIENRPCSRHHQRAGSLPTWGAWIENSNRFANVFATSRSPRGERGLKRTMIGFLHIDLMSLPTWGAWIETRDAIRATWVASVAPHVGSVD